MSEPFAWMINLTDNPLPDDDHVTFFSWIGVCIKEWAKIEAVLFKLCGHVLGAKPQHVAIVYYRTPSLEGRLQLTNELLSSFFPKNPGEHDDPIFVTWKNLKNEIQDMMPIRNELAHSPVEYDVKLQIMLDRETNKSSLDTVHSRIKVNTSRDETLRSGKSNSHDVEAIKLHHRDLQNVWSRLNDFSRDLFALKPLPSTPVQQNIPPSTDP
jgi:hypothetical protein